MKPTKEQVQRWLSDPVTEYWLNGITTDRQEIMEEWANMSYTGDTVEKTVQMNAQALGSIDAIDRMIEAIQDLAEEETQDEGEGY